MLFQGVEVDRPQRVIARDRKIRYEGERVIVKGWSIVWGNPVVDKTDYDLHFRLVYLIDQANVEDSTLHDDRIAVVIPGPWEGTARDISRRYLALVIMQEEYQDKQGPEAEEVKRFVSDELRKARGDIVLTQKSSIAPDASSYGPGSASIPTRSLPIQTRPMRRCPRLSCAMPIRPRP